MRSSTNPPTVSPMSKGAALLLAILAAWAAPTAAQQRGTIELGVFTQRTAFDQLTTLTFGTAPGLGGSVGVFVAPNLSLEAGSSYTWTHPSQPPRVRATWIPLRARAVYGIPVTEQFTPIAGLGIVRNGYSDAVRGSDTGVSALVGFKTYLRDNVTFRSDLHLDRVGTPFNAGETVAGATVGRHTNWSFTAGISVEVGNGRFRDADGDLVRDRDDLCPETPLGVGVDAVGCRLDEDGDTVFDEDDLCPATPPGVGVDAVGCRMDGDRDGVFDEDDLCPGTPVGVGVNAVGCRLDGDRDGVFDEDDLCPATPLGVGVDGFGCRLDGDRDGVFDEDDRCPDSAPGVTVDEVGCEILFEEEEIVIVLEGVTFETSSAELTEEARVVLDRVAGALVANPEIRVRVNGHTDSTGSRAYNLTLSQRRAESVAAYLTERGVAADRTEARGFGPDEPVATNDTPEGRALNRRVELERIG